MRFHVTSLPHTQTTKDYCWCAYTAKVLRFCNMMTSLGHDVFLYGGTENEANVKEFISVVSKEDNEKWFGSCDWNTTVFNQWDSAAECWQEMNAKAAEEIKKRKEPGDFLGIISGSCQYKIKEAIPDLRCVEWGIGYPGIIHDTFHVFESNAWMHYVYGALKIEDGKFFDTVIPNAFDPADYVFKEKKDNYLLYLGRPTAKKGLEVLEELRKRGHKIVTAGQGNGLPGMDHMGVVRGAEKAELLANAKAVLVPTFYIEPFGGVAVEAMISGTPVITTDFGAFTETVIESVTGYRCHTIGEFDRATDYVDTLDPHEIRNHSTKYFTDNVRHKYHAYFKRLKTLDNQGWYQ